LKFGHRGEEFFFDLVERSLPHEECPADKSQTASDGTAAVLLLLAAAAALTYALTCGIPS
jgi:hypothetical protein